MTRDLTTGGTTDEPELGDLLRELAEGVRPADADTLAGQAWLDAGHRRRRRRGVTAVAVAAVVAGGLVVVPLATGRDRAPDPASTPRPTPSASGAGNHLLVAPARSAERTLPLLQTRYPAVLDPGAPSVPLADDPVGPGGSWAIALLQPFAEAPGARTVLVVGSDGRLRRIGTTLAMVPDGYGNTSEPLRAGSLQAEGEVAAFPQRDAVVVVDLTTGQAKRVPLPGYNTDVLWVDRPARLLAVAQADRLVVVDTGTARVVDTAPSLEAYGIPVGFSTTRIAFTESVDGGPATIVRRTTTGAVSAKVTLPTVAQWWGRGYLGTSNGVRSPARERVARAAFSQNLHVDGIAVENPQVLLATGTAPPAAVEMLAFDWDGRYKGCCAVLGWLGDSTVLFSSDGGGTDTMLLAWDVDGRTVRRVSEVRGRTLVSLATQGGPQLASLRSSTPG